MAVSYNLLFEYCILNVFNYYTVYLFFHFTFYVKFFWFSKTYKQLIQVLAEVQHDLWLYSHVSLFVASRLIADSCICGFHA
ncbi:hypothetical protein T4C_3094, partial [Trichinella pseudospiralis]